MNFPQDEEETKERWASLVGALPPTRQFDPDVRFDEDGLPLEPHPVRIEMAHGGEVVVRSTGLTRDIRKGLTALLRQYGYKWDDLNAWRGPSWRLIKLLPALRESFFEPELGSTIASEMGRIASLARAGEERAEAQIAAMEAASGGKFRPYQVEDAGWLASTPCGLLASEMRTGKTLVLLSGIAREGNLVICPIGAVGVWEKHCAQWLPWAKFRWVRRSAEFSWPEAGEVVCVHYEALPDDPGPAPEGIYLPVDEIHRAKNPGSMRGRRTRAVVNAVIRARGHVIGASGTPSENKRDELWAVLQILGGLGARIFGDKRSFNDDLNAGGDEVGTRLASIMRRRTVEEVAPWLPAAEWRDEFLSVKDLDVKLTGKLNWIWDRVKEKGLVGDSEGLLKALQHDPEFAEYSTMRRQLAEAKIPWALSWAEEMGEAGIPVVAYSAHRAPVEALGSLPGWGMIIGGMSKTAKEQVITDFRGGRLQGVAYTIGAGSEGIDLSRADFCLSIDRDWVPGKNDQASARIVNVDPKHARSKSYVRQVVDHPLDSHVETLLCSKIASIGSVMSLVAKSRGGTEAARALEVLGLIQDRDTGLSQEEREKMGNALANLMTMDFSTPPCAKPPAPTTSLPPAQPPPPPPPSLPDPEVLKILTEIRIPD